MLKVVNLTKSFATPEGRNTVIKGNSFEVKEGECCALLEAERLRQDHDLALCCRSREGRLGIISIGNQVVSDPASGIFVPVHQRPIGMVFQSYAIWPHLDVFENVAYPLRVQRRASQDEITARVMDVLKLIGMDSLAQRPRRGCPAASSNALHWRVRSCGVRRCCCSTSRCRISTRACATPCAGACGPDCALGITAMFVTHDQAEAFLAGASYRGDESRPHRPGRHAAADLRPAEFALRRVLHGLGECAGRAGVCEWSRGGTHWREPACD